jgi:hypothetical protein
MNWILANGKTLSQAAQIRTGLMESHLRPFCAYIHVCNDAFEGHVEGKHEEVSVRVGNDRKI